MNTSTSYLGRGWRFPVKPVEPGVALDGAPGDSQAGAQALAPAGFQAALRYAEGADKVAQSIWIILDTDPGERIMRPGFGCGLRRYLMKPNTSATRSLIRHEVNLALANFEPRITLTSLQVDAGFDPAMVLIRVGYVTVLDNRPGNLVYPFYLE